jgi:D-erythritol 1-phosphate dehydrogenase
MMNDLGQIDLVVIGGGINGTGIARDAAGRGLSVILCEKGDLAEGTSSRSGKLIHGGLRYLEYHEFRLVREALIEREVMLRAAPHIVWPLRFVLPHSAEQRPAWLVRLGLFLYDHLGGREQLPGCRRINLKCDPEGKAIKDSFKLAFEYSDCWVDDARLVVLNAMDAASHGANIMVRKQAVAARRNGDQWDIEFRGSDGTVSAVRAKALVNAAGPWVDDVNQDVVKSNAARRVRLVKGSHIITKKFWDGPHSYVFQNADKRIIFANPYQSDFALIGTTDVPFEGNADDVTISDDEISYLIASVNRYTKTQLSRADVVTAYSGVRPLYDDHAASASAVTRDYVFDMSGSPPVLSVFGGKITTYRKLAEHALGKLKPFFPAMGADWTSRAKLPGGNFPDAGFDAFLLRMRRENPWLPDALSERLARLYGSRMPQVLSGARSLQDMGQHFGGGLYQAEVDYLRNNEWAKTTDDILFRRTKTGLTMTAAEQASLRSFLEHP